ncbi:MAG: peptide-methionine (S)-S-oxide reductase MsrA [Vicinamibacteria bacterium]|nr:peptide-methionine (S)-S-oxide reductase MsrA [Vicinamibacteria bacterium]
MPASDNALPGRDQEMEVPLSHFVLGTPLAGPFPSHLERALFGLGCFWRAEKQFWEMTGVFSTAVGYAAGFTTNPSYREVCSGRTGHNEVVLVVFDPKVVPYETLVKVFFESHDPTQGIEPGDDVGTQYRSGIYAFSEAQKATAVSMKAAYANALAAAGRGEVTTEVLDAPAFYYAEDYHQQHLAKNPNGYCGRCGTGASCPPGC